MGIVKGCDSQRIQKLAMQTYMFLESTLKDESNGVGFIFLSLKTKKLIFSRPGFFLWEGSKIGRRLDFLDFRPYNSAIFRPIPKQVYIF